MSCSVFSIFSSQVRPFPTKQVFKDPGGHVTGAYKSIVLELMSMNLPRCCGTVKMMDELK